MTTPKCPPFTTRGRFCDQVLGWEAQHVAGSPGRAAAPRAICAFACREHDTTLSPTWAVRELGGDGERLWQLLVRIERHGHRSRRARRARRLGGTPHQRFERLLRETGVFAGLLITERNDEMTERIATCPELRLVYAPRGETSGYLSFPLRALAQRSPAGRCSAASSSCSILSASVHRRDRSPPVRPC